jgi:hypothetical protein
MEDKDVKDEMRLFALESLFCQLAATLYQSMPRDVFDGVKAQALAGSDKPILRQSATPPLRTYSQANFVKR